MQVLIKSALVLVELQIHYALQLTSQTDEVWQGDSRGLVTPFRLCMGV